ncbi:hypothetical protein [Rhodanobacter sp. DHG33]|uniref:hypothetical protein n=1 Tax=Rhodanobacter sp. DHG33 TaxID=2775921 RepID=UPI0017866C97|nr:hypothetical protein [Rhodanobacter sp. DHG33]MBD8899685.1 hypothetical protein [Rhodanobacter sp. DHG33]
MEHKVFLERLDTYLTQIREILSRFQKSQNSIHIQHGDQARLQQLSLELCDLFNDAFGKNDYSAMIIDAFNNGTSNYFGTSSYASVEQIISISSAAKTRIVNNPEFLTRPTRPASTSASQIPLAAPQKVTLNWLFNNVPYKFWLAAGGIIVASFVAGASVTAKLSIFQQWFGLVCGK